MANQLNLARAPATPEDYAILSDALRRSGRPIEATEAAARGLKLDPADPKAKEALDNAKKSLLSIPARRLALFAGTYSTPFGDLEVRSDGRRLTAQLVDQPVSQMLPLGDDSFLIEAMGVPIRFAEERGQVTHATVTAGGEVTLPKVAPPKPRRSNKS
ncbi:hypothetical protein OMW55_01585 [Sphingomonas sp. BN140010]|uniref:Uncharacterized protein n=1 Tax=Sphingomonas arvum TaxID=2992113 RepID=A0ABT3JBQ1_9SPHN|nr:hypothetical protein [Sphingomonas sp. BN140010]MCW3796502.1 hypothetical protein [Sphingomonas sp. BN140010]